MTIVLIAEGETEAAVRPVLKAFLNERCDEEDRPRVRLDAKRLRSIGNQRKLHAVAQVALKGRQAACVVALRDVYPDFRSAGEAKQWIGRAIPDDARCHAHAAQYEFEAWLLPFWRDICEHLPLKAHPRPPGGQPEDVDLMRPPSHHLSELYRKAGRFYDKPRDALAILCRNDITVAAEQCPELKSLLNTLLECAGLSARL